jgi:hypothetical protein
MRRSNRLPRVGFAFLCITLWARLAAGQPATIAHATCVASMGGTTYVSAGFSAPFEKDARGEQNYHTMVTFGAAFSAYIEQKYGGAKGSSAASCALVASLEQAQAGVKGRTVAAKRMGRPVVETDWVYKSAVPPGAPAPPAQAPAASNATPPNASAQGTTIQAVCWSNLNAPVIYFSQIFDTGLGRPDQGEDMFSPIANEFHQYLKGRYDYNTSASAGAQCVGQLSAAQTSAHKSRVLAQFGSGKRVEELEWQWSRDTSEVPRGVTIPLDGGYCTTSGSTGTVYVAGPFDLKGRMATYDWNRGFSAFVASKYGFKGEANCAIGMPRFRALRHYSFHVQGARAGNKKVVETGWELGAAVASNPAAKPNEDKEPARQPAAAPTPSQNARDVATKDGQEALTTCNQDRATNWAFDCYKVQRLVYNYRIEHAADAAAEPLATLLSDKLDCSSCVDNTRTPAWAKQQAHGSGNQPAVSECVGQRIVATFLKKPHVTRLMEAYNATLAACKR